MKDRGYQVNIRGFIWIQGETDAGDEHAAGRYKENLKELITHLRTRVVNDDNLPVILGVDEQHYFVKDRPIVVESQQQIAEEDKHIIYTSMLGLQKADTTHLTPSGLVVHGQRIFQAYRLLQDGPAKP